MFIYKLGWLFHLKCGCISGQLKVENPRNSPIRLVQAKKPSLYVRCRLGSGASLMLLKPVSEYVREVRSCYARVNGF